MPWIIQMVREGGEWNPVQVWESEAPGPAPAPGPQPTPGPAPGPRPSAVSPAPETTQPTGTGLVRMGGATDGTWHDQHGTWHHANEPWARDSGNPNVYGPDPNFPAIAPAGPPPGGSEAGGVPEFPGSQEIADVLRTQREVIQSQLDQFRALAPTYNELFKTQAALSSAQAKTSLRLLPEQERAYLDSLAALKETLEQRTLREAAERQQLSILQGVAPTISPEQRALLDTVFGEQQRRGMAQIRTFAEEAAAARGLRLTDTPIGAEAERQTQEFMQGLTAERAHAELGLGTQQQQLQSAVSQFQQQLRQQAVMNRAQLVAGGFGGAGSSGANLALPAVQAGNPAETALGLANLGQSAAQLQANLAIQRQQLAQQANLATLGFQNNLEVARIKAQADQPSTLALAAPYAAAAATALPTIYNWWKGT